MSELETNQGVKDALKLEALRAIFKELNPGTAIPNTVQELEDNQKVKDVFKADGNCNLRFCDAGHYKAIMSRRRVGIGDLSWENMNVPAGLAACIANHDTVLRKQHTDLKAHLPQDQVPKKRVKLGLRALILSLKNKEGTKWHRLGIAEGQDPDCGPEIPGEQLTLRQVTLVGRGSGAKAVLTRVKLTLQAVTHLPLDTPPPAVEADNGTRQQLQQKLRAELTGDAASDTGADAGGRVAGAPPRPQGNAAFRLLSTADIEKRLVKSGKTLKQHGIQERYPWIEVLDPLANIADNVKSIARDCHRGGTQGTADQPAFVLGGGDPGIRTFLMVYDASTGKIYRIGHNFAAYIRGRFGIKRDHCISKAAKAVDVEEREKYLNKARRLLLREQRVVRAFHRTAATFLAAVFSDIVLPGVPVKQWAKKSGRREAGMPKEMGRELYGVAHYKFRLHLQE
ncbi:unnamed protein product, partial [Chrysoparadoxa australica]